MHNPHNHSACHNNTVEHRQLYVVKRKDTDRDTNSNIDSDIPSDTQPASQTHSGTKKGTGKDGVNDIEENIREPLTQDLIERFNRSSGGECDVSEKLNQSKHGECDSSESSFDGKLKCLSLSQQETDHRRPPQTLVLGCVRKKIIPDRDLLVDCHIETSSQQVRFSTHGSGRLFDYPDLEDSFCEENFFADSDADEEAETSDASLWSDLEGTMESLDTPDCFRGISPGGQLQWNDATSPSSITSTDITSSCSNRHKSRDEDDEASTGWKAVQIGDRQHRLDLKVIEPYKRILSHGGYYGDGFNTIVVLTASYLPDRRRRDYHYVMRNLFLYVISTLELLVMDEYTVVYFHGSVARQRMPSFRWFQHCYLLIDRKFKRNLKSLLIVHPTLFLRTILVMTKPFISSKFYAKLRYVKSLKELKELIPMDHIYIPDEVKEYDSRKNGQSSK